MTNFISLAASDYTGNLLAAIGGRRDNVHVFYRPASGSGVRHSILTAGDLPSSETVDSAPSPDFPTVARDADGDLHLFWRYISSAPTQYHIRYSRLYPVADRDQWAAITEPSCASGSQWTGVTAGVFASQIVLLART